MTTDDDTRRITYDASADAIIEPGVVLKSIRGRAVYLIVSARKVNSRKHSRRFSLQVLRITDRDIKPDNVVLPLFWHSRRRHGR